MFRYHILQGPAWGAHMLELNMQDSGGEEAAAGEGLRKVGAWLPCECPQDM